MVCRAGGRARVVEGGADSSHRDEPARTGRGGTQQLSGHPGGRGSPIWRGRSSKTPTTGTSWHWGPRIHGTGAGGRPGGPDDAFLHRVVNATELDSFLAVVTTLRRDGTPHSSLVNAAVVSHSVGGAPVGAFVTYGPAKLPHLRCRPAPGAPGGPGSAFIAPPNSPAPIAFGMPISAPPVGHTGDVAAGPRAGTDTLGHWDAVGVLETRRNGWLERSAS